MTDRVISIYETLADVPSDFTGLARVGGDTTNYSILINATKVNGVITRNLQGSGLLASRPSAALFGVGTWQDGGALTVSNGSSWASIAGSGGARVATWATRGLVSEYPGELVFISNAGVNGSLWSAGATRWNLAGTATLQENNKGWIVASLAAADATTYSQTGTLLTVTCAGHLMSSKEDGSDIYLPIGTVSTGVAPTAPVYGNWFQNFTYVNASTFTCTAGNSQTGTGTILTNIDSTVINELDYTVNGGMMGLNCSLCSTATLTRSNDASNKLMSATFGSVAYQAPVGATSWQAQRAYAEISNNNSEAAQFSLPALFSGFGQVTNAPTTSNVDTSIDQAHQIRLSVSAALGFICLHQYRLELK